MRNTPTFDFAFHLVKKLVASNSIWEFNTVLSVDHALLLPQLPKTIVEILMEYVLTDLERHFFKKETLLTLEIDMKKDFNEIMEDFLFLTSRDGLKLVHHTLCSPETLSEIRSKATLKVCHLLALEQASQRLGNQNNMFSTFSAMIDWGEYPWKVFHAFLKMNPDNTAIQRLITLSVERISTPMLMNLKKSINNPELDMRDVLYRPFLQALEAFLIEQKAISPEPEPYKIPFVQIKEKKSQLPALSNSQFIFPPDKEFARFGLKAQDVLIETAINYNRIDVLKTFYQRFPQKFTQASLNLIKKKEYRSIKSYLPAIFADYLLTAITDGRFSVNSSAYPPIIGITRIIAAYLVDQKDDKYYVIDSIAKWLIMSPAAWLYVLFNLFDSFPIIIAPNHEFKIKISSPRALQFWPALRNIFLVQLLGVSTIVEALFQCRVRSFPQQFLNLIQDFDVSNPLSGLKRAFIPSRYLHRLIVTFFDSLATLSANIHRDIIRELFYEVTDWFSDKFLFEIKYFKQLFNNNPLFGIFMFFKQYSRFPFPSAYFHLKFNHIDQAVLKHAEYLTRSLYPYSFAKNQKEAMYAALEKFDMPDSFNQENYNFLVAKLANALIEQNAPDCQHPNYERAYENVFAMILKRRSLEQKTKKPSLRTSEQKISTDDNWEMYAPLLSSQIEKNYSHAVEPIDPTYADLFTQLTDNKANSQQITAVLADSKNQSRLKKLAKTSLSEISRLLGYALLHNIAPLADFLFKNFPISLVETILSQLVTKTDMERLSKHTDSFIEFLIFLYSKSPADSKNLQRFFTLNKGNYLFTEPLTYALTALRAIFCDQICYEALAGETENKLHLASQLDKTPVFLTPLILILAYAFPCEEKISIQAMRALLNLLVMPPSSQIFLIKRILIRSNLIKIDLQLSTKSLNITKKIVLFIGFFISAIQISMKNIWNIYLSTLPYNLVKKIKSEVFSPDLRTLLSMVENEQKLLSTSLNLNECSNQFLFRIMQIFMVKLSARLSEVVNTLFCPKIDPKVYCIPSDQSTLPSISKQIKDTIATILTEMKIERKLRQRIRMSIIRTINRVSPNLVESKFNPHKESIDLVLQTLDAQFLNIYFSETVNTLSFMLLSFDKSITSQEIIQKCKAILQGIYLLVEHESLPTSSSDPRAIKALSNVLVTYAHILYSLFFKSLQSKNSTEDLFDAVYQKLINNLIDRLSRSLDEKVEEKKSTLIVQVKKPAYAIGEPETHQDRNFNIYASLLEPLSIETVSLDFLPVKYQSEFMTLITKNIVNRDIQTHALLAIPEIKQAFDTLARSSNPEQLSRLLNWALYSEINSLSHFIFYNYPSILAQAMAYYPLNHAAMDDLSATFPQHFEKFINFISQQAPREIPDLARLDLAREGKGSFNNSIEFAVSALHDFFLDESCYVVPTVKRTRSFYILNQLFLGQSAVPLKLKRRPLLIIAAYAFPLEEKQAVPRLCTLMSLLSLPLQFQASLIKKVGLRFSSKIFRSLTLDMNIAIGKQPQLAIKETSVTRVFCFFWSALIASIEESLNKCLKKFPEDFKAQINLNIRTDLVPLLQPKSLLYCLTSNSTEVVYQTGRELFIACQEKFMNVFSSQQHKLFQGVVDVRLKKALASEANTVIKNISSNILIHDKKYTELTERVSSQILPLKIMDKIRHLHLTKILMALKIQRMPLPMINAYFDQIVNVLYTVVEKNPDVQPVAIYVNALKSLALEEKEYDKEKLFHDAMSAMMHTLKTNILFLWEKFCGAFSTDPRTADRNMRKIFDELFRKLIQSLESGNALSTSDDILEISQNRRGMFSDRLMIPSSLSSSSSSSSSSYSSSSSSPSWASRPSQ